MTMSTLSSKGQVTIPKAVRDHLELEPGASVEFLIHADGSVQVRKRFDTARPLRGALQRYAPEEPVSLQAMDEATAREVARLDQSARATARSNESDANTQA